MKEDLQDLENVGSEELSSEEICEEMISEEVNQDNTEENDVDDTMNEQIVQEEIPNIQKGVDIYVENDISSLESMLGIKHESIIDEVEDDEDIENETEAEEICESNDINIEDDVDSVDVKDVVPKYVPYNESKKEAEHITESLDVSSLDNISDAINQKEEPDKISFYDALYTDFMTTDNSVLSCLYHTKDKQDFEIRDIDLSQLKRSGNRTPSFPDSNLFIYRYPIYKLSAPILGFKEEELVTTIKYSVYFPEYIVSFIVTKDMKKPYIQSMTDYIDDMFNRQRPMELKIAKLFKSISIDSLRVVEAGILAVVTDTGNHKMFCVKDEYNSISFFDVLAYIRDESDEHPDDSLSLKLLCEYFKEI